MTRGYSVKKTTMSKTTGKPVGIVQTIKNKIINGASDVLSLPARLSADRQIRQSNSDVKVLKADRANKQAGYSYNPNEGDYTDPKFRTAVEAIGVRDRLARNTSY